MLQNPLTNTAEAGFVIQFFMLSFDQARFSFTSIWYSIPNTMAYKRSWVSTVPYWCDQKQPPGDVLWKSYSEEFSIIYKKTHVLELFFNKAAGPAVVELIKRFRPKYFLWILGNFSDQLFCRTPAGDCLFLILYVYSKKSCQNLYELPSTSINCHQVSFIVSRATQIF